LEATDGTDLAKDGTDLVASVRRPTYYAVPNVIRATPAASIS
jgi:hypothetical protein